MRAVVFILIIVVLLLIGAIASGFLNINQTREAAVPNLATTGNGVTASGGQTPAFQVETGSVKVGSKDATVKMPRIEVQRPGNSAAQNQAAPAPAPGNAQ